MLVSMIIVLIMHDSSGLASIVKLVTHVNTWSAARALNSCSEKPNANSSCTCTVFGRSVCYLICIVYAQVLGVCEGL